MSKTNLNHLLSEIISSDLILKHFLFNHKVLSIPFITLTPYFCNRIENLFNVLILQCCLMFSLFFLKNIDDTFELAHTLLLNFCFFSCRGSFQESKQSSRGSCLLSTFDFKCVEWLCHVYRIFFKRLIQESSITFISIIMVMIVP